MNIRAEYLDIINKIGLRDDIEELVEFYRNFLKSKYDYKILMSRRSFVLYQICTQILVEQDEAQSLKELADSQTIITDKALAVNLKNMRGKSCVIVDDVLIHGRTVRGIYKDVKDSGVNSEKFRVCVYGYNAESNFENTIDNFHYIEKFTQTGWKILSNKLVQLIHAAGMAYTSFVLSYEVDAALYDMPLEDKFQKVYMTSDEQIKARMESCVLFDNSIQPEGYKKCVRVYRNRGRNQLRVIPTVFLPSMGKDEFENYCKELPLPDEFAHTREILIDKSIDGSFRYRLLIAISSLIYAAHFFDLVGMQQSFVCDYDTIRSSFSSEIEKEFEQFVREMSNGNSLYADLLNYEASWVGKAHIGKLQEDAKMCDAMKKAISVTTDCVGYFACLEILNAYFTKTGEMDEQSAIDDYRSPRMQGLTCKAISDLLTKSPNKFNQNDVYAALISTWDSGISSMNGCLSSDGNFYGMFNNAGERSVVNYVNNCGADILNLSDIEAVLRDSHIQSSKNEIQELISKTFEGYLKFREKHGLQGRAKEYLNDIINFVSTNKIPISRYCAIEENDAVWHDNGFAELRTQKAKFWEQHGTQEH